MATTGKFVSWDSRACSQSTRQYFPPIPHNLSWMPDYANQPFRPITSSKSNGGPLALREVHKDSQTKTQNQLHLLSNKPQNELLIGLHTDDEPVSGSSQSSRLTPIPLLNTMYKPKQHSDGNSTTVISEVRSDTIQPSPQDLAPSNDSSTIASSKVRPDIIQPTTQDLAPSNGSSITTSSETRPDIVQPTTQDLATSNGSSTTTSSAARPDIIQPNTQGLATSNGSSTTVSIEVRPDILQPTSNDGSAFISDNEPRTSQSAKRDLATSNRGNSTDGNVELENAQSAKRPKLETSISFSDQAILDNLHSSLTAQAQSDKELTNPDDIHNRYPLRSSRRSSGLKSLADSELPLSGIARHAMIRNEAYLVCLLQLENFPRPYSVAVPIETFGSNLKATSLQSSTDTELTLAGGAQRVTVERKPYLLCQLRIAYFPRPYSFAVPLELFGSDSKRPTIRFRWTTEEDDLIKDMRGEEPKQSWESIQNELPNYRTLAAIQVRHSKIAIYR